MARTWKWKRWLSIAVAICSLLTSTSGQTSGQGSPPPRKPEEEVWEMLRQAAKLRDEQQYDAALALAERSLSIAEKTLDSESLEVAAALAIIASEYHRKGDLKRAESLYQRALKTGEKELGNEHAALLPVLSGLANLYYQQDQYDKAEPLYQRALLVTEKAYGAQHLWVAGTLHRLGFLYKKKGELDKAESFLSRALAIFEKAQGPEHLDTGPTLYALTEVNLKKKNYQQAEQLLQRALAFVVQKFGSDDNDSLIPALIHFASLYEEQGQRDKAEALYQRALEVGAESGKPKYLDVAYTVRFFADKHLEKKEIDKAEPLYLRALQFAEKALGAEHVEVASFHDKLAALYETTGNLDKAEAFYKRALAIYEKDVGSGQNTAYALAKLAWLHREKREYDKAETLFKRAITVAERALGSNHKIIAIFLNSLSSLHFERKEYDKAEPLLVRGLEISEKALGIDHLDLVLIIHRLAGLYSAKGNYGRAESLHLRALAIQEKALGSKHPDIAASLDRLAWMYDGQAEYGKAEAAFQRALAIREEALGSEHPDVATSLGVLASRYENRGDYRRAEPMYLRALAIREKALGAEHPDVADSLHDLAGLYFMQKDYGKAESLSQRALKIIEKTFGVEHPDNAYVLNQLALIYKGQGNFEKAEPLYQRALKIVEKVYGTEHTSITQSLHNLALLHIAKEEHGKAEPLLQRALAIEEKAYGSAHPDLAESLTSIVYMYAAKGDTPRAVAALTRGTEISERTVSRVLATAAGTEEQKRAFMAMQDISNETHGAVSLHLQLAPKDLQAAHLALTTVLRRKGRVLDAMSESMQTLRRRTNSDSRALLDQLSVTRSQLAAKIFETPDNANRAQFLTDVTKLEEQEQRLEASVSARSAEFRIESQPATIETIQKAIPTNAALVEIVAYRPFNLRYKTDSSMWGAWRYAAYVLRRDGAPLWTEIGDAASATSGADVDKAVAEFRRALSSTTSESEVRLAARKLDRLVMQPIRKLVGDARHILLSPDGALNLVPFGALVDEQNRYLVENYTITYLTSGRDLLRLSTQVESTQPPVVIANPLFDAGVGNVATGSTPDVLVDGVRGRRSGDVSQMQWTPLKGTAQEAAALGAMLPNSHVLTEAQATESALKRVAAPRILHVATHGFFLPDQSIAAPDLRAGELRGTSPRVAQGENPLLRSGLALAGANKRLGGAGEDGILTALEAAGLDLWGTKLVVLSACETGIGEVRNGDGVYGLRRALVLAGAESQVMTLWQVSDAATRDLIVAYYRRLQAGEGRTEALRQVQLEMLKNIKHSHPYFWAGVIQSGDWRSMNHEGTGAR